MDPQQRLLLEIGYAALHGAMHRRNTLFGGDCGVCLGMEHSEWSEAMPPEVQQSFYAAAGMDSSVSAARLSFTLGLTGFCVSIDTACASALSALHAASSFVRSGEAAHAVHLSVGLKLSVMDTLSVANAGMPPLGHHLRVTHRRSER